MIYIIAEGWVVDGSLDKAFETRGKEIIVLYSRRHNLLFNCM